MTVKQQKGLIQKIKENAFVRTITTILLYSILTFGIHLFNLNITNSEFTPFNYAFTYILISIIFVWKHKFVLGHFKRLGSDLKDNYKSVIYAFCLGTFAALFLTFIYANVFKVVSANEANIESTIKYSILQMIPVTLLLAPMAEELTYRAILTDLEKHRLACAIISSLLFGTAHILAESNLFCAAIYLIPYTIVGFSFAFGALKTNNSLVSILMHMAYNLVNFVILLCI